MGINQYEKKHIYTKYERKREVAENPSKRWRLLFCQQAGQSIHPAGGHI